MGYRTRRRLTTLLDVGGIVSGGGPPIPASGLGVWYRADQEVTSAGDGQPVTAWGDSGASGWDLGQATVASQPTLKTNERNGLPVVRFDGTDDFMVSVASILGSYLAGTQAQTVFVVQKQDAADLLTSSTCTYGWDSSGALTNEISAHLKLSNNSLYHITGTATGGSGFVQATAPEPWVDTWHIAELVRDGTTNSSMTIEGNPLTIATFPSTGLNTAGSSFLRVGERIGGGNTFGGDIAELIIFNRVLTTTERDNIRNYLKSKWGIAQNKVVVNTARTGYVRINSTTNDRWAFN